jgi:LmbE family N-acetylglucosaminyl deacetylase
MRARGRSLRPVLSALALVASAAAAGAADHTVLAIDAHAGDAEITAGAILARHRRLGDRVVMLHLTLGEGGNPKMSPAAYAEQKKREALAAARALGAEVLFGPWKDGELRDTEEAARYVADVIRQVKPTHVITHWKASLHPDHEAAYRIVARPRARRRVRQALRGGARGGPLRQEARSRHVALNPRRNRC